MFETKLTIFELGQRIFQFIFTAIFLGSSGLFFYLAYKYYLFAKSAKDVAQNNKMILYVVLGMIFLLISVFVPGIILNFLGQKVSPESFPTSAPIIAPTGTYTPIPF